MAYITQQEYVTAMHVTEALNNFDELLELASMYVDDATNDYYQYNKIDDDKFTLRVFRFKRAIMFQIKYMADTGYKTQRDYHNAQVQSTSQSIGKTSVSRTFSSSNANESGGILCDEALKSLAGVGLTYRGVMHV